MSLSPQKPHIDFEFQMGFLLLLLSPLVVNYLCVFSHTSPSYSCSNKILLPSISVTIKLLSILVSLMHVMCPTIFLAMK